MVAAGRAEWYIGGNDRELWLERRHERDRRKAKFNRPFRHGAPRFCAPGLHAFFPVRKLKQGVMEMLPCRTGCGAYCEGCHKSCEHWRDFQAAQRAEREAKKRYMQFHSERCAQITRQLRATQARYHIW